jgi:hypothetical protein
MEQDAPEPEPGVAGPSRPDPGRPEPAREAQAHLVFVTHPAFERDMQACLHELRQLDSVRRIGSLVRVVGH